MTVESCTMRVIEEIDVRGTRAYDLIADIVVQRVNATLVLLFFFSSRRRHTRCSRDWSSDVCSSDLSEDPRCLVEIAHHRQHSLAAVTAALIIVPDEFLRKVPDNAGCEQRMLHRQVDRESVV